MKSFGDVQREENSSLLSAVSGPPVRWSRSTVIALVALIVLWAVKFYSTWATWGSLTVDCGREMYVPALLAEGKVLYRDTWFVYGPSSVYLNSYFFRLFGVHLNVLYWAGAISALGSAIFLYLAGMRLSSWLTGWTAAAILLTEAFQPSLFSFPLPYSFAAVYGCLAGCTFLWLILNSAASTTWLWMFAAGTASAIALLMKPEFGIAAYMTVFALIIVRGFLKRSGKSFVQDILAILPGVFVCALTIRWMVRIAGVEFITQENIMSWPTSYFMQTYGKRWLRGTGFSLQIADLSDALIRTLPLIVAWFLADWILRWKRHDRAARALKMALFLFFIFGIADLKSLIKTPWYAVEVSLGRLFFPQDMVLYVAVAACAFWWYFWRERSEFALAVALLLTFATMLAFRILLGMSSEGYPIYYNGPVVLCFLFLARLIIPRAGHTQRFIFVGEAAICLSCLTVVAIHTRTIELTTKNYVPLNTERGTIRVPKEMSLAYAEAIGFMKGKAALGESVLSVPEDTSLYFLSGTYCPTRVYLFNPGAIAPGKMTDDTIREIERQPVRYLLWSNRIYTEYGAAIFGKDYDQILGTYFTTHYRPVRQLVPFVDSVPGWTAVIWERKPKNELIRSINDNGALVIPRHY
jgi:hypothetical protein